VTRKLRASLPPSYSDYPLRNLNSFVDLAAITFACESVSSACVKALLAAILGTICGMISTEVRASKQVAAANNTVLELSWFDALALPSV